MSNELRQRQMFLGGLVEDNPLTAAATTLTSASLAAMQVVDTTMHLPIILDPDGVAGAPEIAYVTAHAAAATTATILRNQESTTARQHNKNIPWLHGPTTIDWTAAATLTKTAPKVVFAENATAVSVLATDVNKVLAQTTLTAAPAGTYLMIGSVYVATAGVGSWRIDAAGTQVGSTDDPRTLAATRRTMSGIYVHAGGDLIVTLYAGGETGGGTTTYGIGGDPRFSSKITVVQVADSVTGGITGVPVAASTTPSRDTGGSATVAPGATSPAMQTRSITLTKTQTVVVFGTAMVVTGATNAAGRLQVKRDTVSQADFRWHNESPSSTCRFAVPVFHMETLAAGTYVFTLTGNNDAGSGISITYEFADLVVNVLDMTGVVVSAPIPLSIGISATNKLMSALPQTYPEGLSVMWANTADGWPTYGLIRTMRYGTDVSQVIESVVATTVQRRYANSGGNTWTAFA